ncbi:MAG: tautomerase family protein [Pyrinomonadaceae bacterium]
MPYTLIEARRQFTPEEEAGIIDAVHLSLQTAFKIPATDKNIRLIVHEPSRFAVSSTLTNPDYVVLISIDAFQGRTIDAKRNLYRNIVDKLEPFGIPTNHVKIVIREIPLENWGIKGGQAACDIDLGFRVDV